MNIRFSVSCSALISILFLAACAKPTPEQNLIGAAATGDLQEIKRLLSLGVNVNCTDNSKVAGTPLIWAAYEGQQESVLVLLSGGADPNIRDGRGYTALSLALVKRRDQSAAIRALVLAGANTDECRALVSGLAAGDPNRIAFEEAIKFRDQGLRQSPPRTNAAVR
jgi:hypothetical protein